MILSSNRFALYAMGIIYMYLGVLHFTNTDFYFPYMPNFIPFHKEMILISGLFEILLGFSLFFVKIRKYALWGLILMLIVFMTVHLNMLLPENNLGNPIYLLGLRVLIQFVLIYCCWFYIKNPKL